MPNLFTHLKIGSLTLPNRILMAPLTRCRADADHNPTDLMAEYYTQRASAGLIIAEATMAIAGNSSFWREPGIYSEEQVTGWQNVTDKVHQAGGRIFLQIWHGGRACHPLLNNGVQPVAPSPLAIIGDEVHTPEGKKPYVTPRELIINEIPEIVKGFGAAALNAKRAGFDGIEVHGANGYLIDQFLRDGSNKRQDAYGGTIENRARLLFEILEEVAKHWESQQIGLRISPLNSYNSMQDSDPITLSTWLAKELNAYKLGYLHVMRGDFFQAQKGDVITPVRHNYTGNLLTNMGYSPEEADKAIENGVIDAVAFGTAFLANPDLPERIKRRSDLNSPDPTTFYSAGAKGYTDYPVLAA